MGNTEDLVLIDQLELESMEIHRLCEDDNSYMIFFVEVNRHIKEINNLFKVYRYNLETFLEGYMVFNSDVVQPKKMFINGDYITVNAMVTNIVSAGTSLVDSINCFCKECEKNKKYFSKNLIENFYDNVISSEYDNEFAYKFGYFLRNYSQHCHLPVSFNNEKYSFDLYRILITPHFNFNKKLKKELEEYRDKIMTDYADTPTISFSNTLVRYNYSIHKIYYLFFEKFKSMNDELLKNLEERITKDPEIINKNNGYIFYENDDSIHCINPGNHPEELYSSLQEEALDYYEKERKHVEGFLQSSFII